MQHGILPLLQLVSSPSFLKVVRIHMICKPKSYIFAKKSPFIIKTTTKTSLHLLRMKIIGGTITAIKLLCITIAIGCCIQQRLFLKGQGYSVTKVLENYFNMISTHATSCNSPACSLGHLIISAVYSHKKGAIIRVSEMA